MGAQANTAVSETGAEEPTRGWLRRLAGPLIALFTLIILLAGLELTAYIWEKNLAQGPLGWTMVASRRMPLERQGDVEQPYYTLQENADYEWETIPVHINSRGFRGDEFTVPKPPGTFRILNIGDSVAFGWEVGLDETYGQQVAAALNETDDGLHYEVINAGTPGWNLETARNFLVQEGLSYDPDLILLEITVVNDINGKGPNREPRSGITDWMRDNTHFWPFLTTQARLLLSKRQGPEAIPELNPPSNVRAYYPLDESAPAYDRLWKFVTEIEEVSQANDIPLVLVVFPTAMQINSSGHSDLPQRILAQRSAENGIALIDLLPVFDQACRDLGQDACEGYENALFADVWMHPNKLGHQLAAQQILSTYFKG